MSVATRGFEPLPTDPKTVVLPLHHVARKAGAQPDPSLKSTLPFVRPPVLRLVLYCSPGGFDSATVPGFIATRHFPDSFWGMWSSRFTAKGLFQSNGYILLWSYSNYGFSSSTEERIRTSNLALSRVALTD